MSTKTHKGLTFGLLYDQEYIRGVIDRIANEVNAYYENILKEEGTLDLVVICILKGAFMFYSDLVKQIKFEHTNEFIRAKSYAGTNSTGDLHIETELKPENFAGKSLLIIEDIHDTGNTLMKLIKVLEGLKPRRIDTAVLVKRPDRPVLIDLKFYGLVCDDFIVGYGLDFDEFGRSFPEIYQKIN